MLKEDWKCDMLITSCVAWYSSKFSPYARSHLNGLKIVKGYRFLLPLIKKMYQRHVTNFFQNKDVQVMREKIILMAKQFWISHMVDVVGGIVWDHRTRLDEPSILEDGLKVCYQSHFLLNLKFSSTLTIFVFNCSDRPRDEKSCSLPSIRKLG